MLLQHQTDDEILATAKNLSGYSEAGPVLKELARRWQVQRDLNTLHHQQLIALAAEAEAIRQHAFNQADITSEILTLLESTPLSPEQRTIATASIEKLVLAKLPATENALKQLQAETLREAETLLSDCLSRHSMNSRKLSNTSPHFIHHLIRGALDRKVAELIYLPIGPVPVERDDDGRWTHPAYVLTPDWDEGTPENEIRAWFQSHNLETATVDLADQDDELLDSALEDPDAVIRWEPTPPDGIGWFLLCIFDSEDGIHAQYARHLETA